MRTLLGFVMFFVVCGISVNGVDAAELGMAPARPTAMPAPKPAPKPAAMLAPKAATKAPAMASTAMEAPKAPASMDAPVKATEPKAAPAEAAKVDVPKKESAWQVADKWLERISKLLMALLSVIAMVLGWTVGNGWKKNKRLQKILGYADKAFPMVESLAAKTKWKGDDKLAEFLKRVSDWLKAEGDYDMTAEEMSVLKKEAADKAAAQANKKEVKPEVVARAKKNEEG